MARRYRVQHGDTATTAEIQGDGVVLVDGKRCTVTPFGPSRYRVTAPDGRVTVVTVTGAAPALWASTRGRTYDLDVDPSGRPRTTARTAGAEMTPPMPATVVQVLVDAGAGVEAGAPLVILEAMKMELTIRASHPGTVRAVRCAVGDLVRPGTVLVEIDQ
ncbi:MAG TPA: biotin/lipoyl-containing protein [Vicinamibacterales bacterium]|nr:biotin/lipoyl-containing protein [Vicinamibacterales bacterium]